MGSGCTSPACPPPGQPDVKLACANCGNFCQLKALGWGSRSEKPCSICGNAVAGSEWRYMCTFGCNYTVCLACGRRDAAVKSVEEALEDSEIGHERLASLVEQAIQAGVPPDTAKLEEANSKVAAMKKQEEMRKAVALARVEELENTSGGTGLVDELEQAIKEAVAAGCDNDQLSMARSRLKHLQDRQAALSRLARLMSRGDLTGLQESIDSIATVVDEADLIEAREALAEFERRQASAREGLTAAMNENAGDEDMLAAAIKEGESAKLPLVELSYARQALKKAQAIREATERLKEAEKGGQIFGGMEEVIRRAELAGVPDEALQEARTALRNQHQLKKDAKNHVNGAVIWVSAVSGFPDFARAIEDVRQARAVLLCASPTAAKDLISYFDDGSVVCLVCTEDTGAEMGEYLRQDPRISPQLRSVPLVWITSNRSLRPKAGDLGLVMEGDVRKLSRRVLSLPTLPAIRSEARAGSFQGNTTDVRFGHFKDSGMDIKFTDNEQVLLASIQRSRLSWYPEVEGYDDHISRLEAYFQGLQPVHRCKPATFLAILREGGLMSREELEYLLGSSSSAIMRTARHVRLQELAAHPRFAKSQRWIFKYAESCCELKLATTDGAKKKAAEKMEKTRPRDLGSADLAELEAVVQDVVKDVLAQKTAKIGGIGYDKDKILGTTRHVFATLGPNAGFHYGSVVIFLSRNLMYHPGFWCSPLAATGFVGPNFWVFRHRPWGSAALLDMALGGGSEEASDLKDAPETPEADSEGVDACLKSALNMAAMDNWPRIMAREVDAMCHYLVSGQREPYTFDLPYDSKKCKAVHRKILAKSEESTTMVEDAWNEVRDYYESKDSHTLYECHLPGFVPLGAITKVIVSDKLYNEHTDIKAKVDTFVMPDGRKLKDMMVITKTKEECMSWQHSHFDNLRNQCLEGRLPHRPISVYMAGRAGRPAFLPPDFPSWYASGGDGDHDTELCISFACRATHDIRVAFASKPHAQRKDIRTDSGELRRTTYVFCLGYSFNRISYITKGVLGDSKSLKYFQDDKWARCAASGSGAEATTVWERYWFTAETLGGGRCRLRCGRGPKGENVLMEVTDTDAISDLKYIGLACWNQPTTFCDIKVE